MPSLTKILNLCANLFDKIKKENAIVLQGNAKAFKFFPLTIYFFLLSYLLSGLHSFLPSTLKKDKTPIS